MKKLVSFLLSLILVLGLVAIPAGAVSTNAESTLYNDVPKTIQVNGATFNGTYNSKSKKLTYKVNKSNYEDFDPLGLYNIFAWIMRYQSSVIGINSDFTTIPEEYIQFFSIAFNDMIRTGKIKTIKFDFGTWHGNPQGYSFVFQTKNNHVTRMDFNVEEGGGEPYFYSYDQKGNLRKITYGLDETSYYKINQKDDRITTIVYYENNRVKEIITPEYNADGVLESTNFAGNYSMLDFNGVTDNNKNIISASETVTYDNGVSKSTPTVKFTYMKI